MTVAELIEELSKHDASFEVMTEGCDCWGDSEAVEVVSRVQAEARFSEPTGDRMVVICRSGGDVLGDKDLLENPPPPKPKLPGPPWAP